MSIPLLSRTQSHRPAPHLTVMGPVALSLGRVHEICGSARRTLALMVAAASEGPVFWIQLDWAADRLYPDTVAAFIPPGRLTHVRPLHPTDLLWCMEETLRCGAVPLVIADLPDPPGLTPVRRLHLAAEAGAATGRSRPIGLILTPGQGGAAGVESRWHMAPRHGGDHNMWRLDRLRARTAPPKTWHLHATADPETLSPAHPRPMEIRDAP